MIRPTLAISIVLAFSASLAATAFMPYQSADFTELKDEYQRLNTYLAAKRRIDADDRTAIVELRNNVEKYLSSNPEDPRAITLDIQLSTWLGDDSRVDEAFSQLSSLSDDDRVWLAWAKSRVGENRYDDAYVLLADRETDLATSPATAMVMAQCLMARNRFDEATSALDSIPEEGLESNPQLRGQVSSMKAQANRWKSLWNAEVVLREQEDADSDLPIIQLVTSRGPITLVLFENQAPNTVSNFVSLSEKGFYNGHRFHRVVPNFVAQAGDPNSRLGSTEIPGSGGPGYTIPDEVSRPDKRLHFAGVIAMAKPADPTSPGRSKPNSAGSQWYLTLEPKESLNAQYTVFGRVIDGQEVAERLRKNDEILAVKTISRREKDYIPTTIPAVDAPSSTVEPETTEPLGG